MQYNIPVTPHLTGTDSSAPRCRLSKLALADLLGSCPKLQRLQLYWNLNVTDVVLHTLAGHCPKLTHLNLSGCKRITDAGVKAVAASCSGLVDIDLTRRGLQCACCLLLAAALGFRL